MEKNKKGYKAALHTIRALIIASCLLFGPSGVKNLKHWVQTSGKSYELDSKDEMLDIIAKKLREMGINNSVVATQFITNMALDGYFTIDGCKSINYDITGESDFNIVLNGVCNETNIAELSSKILEKMFGDEIETYTVSVDSSEKKENDPDQLYTKYFTNNMLLVHDRILNITYICSPLNNIYVRMDSLGTNSDKNANYKINFGEALVKGKITILDIPSLNGNDNDVFSKDNFNKLVENANQLYERKDIKDKLYDMTRSTRSNQVKIYEKVIDNIIID